jgi:molecular chaperone DnaK
VLVEWIAKRFADKHGFNILEDKIAKQQLYMQAEQARINLSQIESADILIPYIATGKNGPVHLKQTITRKKLNELSRDFLRHLRELVETTLDENGIARSWATDIVFAGGVTRMPAVRNNVLHILDGNVTIWNDLNPDEAPVMGAGLLAGKFSGHNSDFFICKDITVHDIGIEDDQGNFVTLIKKGTTYPVAISKIFTTTTDNQREIAVHLLQRTIDGTIISLGSFIMPELPPRPAGELPIEVTVSINENRLIKVTALEREGGREMSITEKVDHSLEKKGYARRGTGLKIM